MKNNDINSIEVSSQENQNIERSRAGKSVGYRSPRVVEIGKAEGLVRNDINGRLKDYSGSWYVWGS